MSGDGTTPDTAPDGSPDVAAKPAFTMIAGEGASCVGDSCTI